MRIWLAFLLALAAVAARPYWAAAEDAPPRAAVVVASPVMEKALAPWVKHREAQGYEIEIVRPQADFESTRRVVHEAIIRRKAQFLVLVGDAYASPAQRAAYPGHAVIPAARHEAKVNVLFGGEGPIVGDNAYADLDGDHAPDVAVGRLTVDTPQELSDLVRRIIAYETSPADTPWRRRVHLVAGVGNFGPLIDSVLESATKKFLMDGIPDAYETTITQASWRSAYCPDPRRFSEVTQNRLTDGGLFWVYLGHGHTHGLDRFWISRDQHYRIMETTDAKRLASTQGPPIAVLLACHTGAFDLPQDCFAEELLRAPGGPIAIICGSRVTMPYGNSVFGDGLLEGYFQQRLGTLGEVFHFAKRRLAEKESVSKNRRLFDQLAQLVSPSPKLLPEERIEHLHLYQLLGDPLLALPQPKEIAITAPEAIRSGEALEITFDSPVKGRTIIEVVCPRDRNRHGVSNRFDLPTLDSEWKALQETYAKANDVCWVAAEVDVLETSAQYTLKLPPECEGLCYIRIHTANGKDFGLGSKPLTVEKAEAPPVTPDSAK